jgi:hypothetical protein
MNQRPNQPRIPPLPESEWDSETIELMQTLRRDGQVFNIFATLARHPKLLKRWLVFGNHVLSKSSLPAREREIAILRMAGYAAPNTSGAITSLLESKPVSAPMISAALPPDPTLPAGIRSRLR